MEKPIESQNNASSPEPAVPERYSFLDRFLGGKENINLLLTLLQVVFTILGFILIIISIRIAREQLKIASDQLQQQVVKLDSNLTEENFTISLPASNSPVLQTDWISGITPYPTLHHYILITAEDGNDWVQDKPATVNPSGSWIGRARFGEIEAGISEKFIVRCIATKDELKSGMLESLPVDAKFSAPVVVIR